MSRRKMSITGGADDEYVVLAAGTSENRCDIRFVLHLDFETGSMGFSVFGHR